MFFSWRYNIGIRLCSVAAVCNALIGDGRVLPAANQFSSSATQKSESRWLAMACVCVKIMSFSMSNSWPVSIK